MEAEFIAKLNSIREKTVEEVLRVLSTASPVNASATKVKKEKYYISTNEQGNTFQLPTKAGVYVFYSKKSDEPIYVGETNNLNRRVGFHCTKGETSSFRKIWVKNWISNWTQSKSPTEEQCVEFIHRNLYFKYVELPFGRKEVEENLLLKWGIRGWRSIKKEQVI